MEDTQRATLIRWTCLGAGAAMSLFGGYQIIRYGLGYPISFAVPGTPIRGTGAQIVSVYTIIGVIGSTIFHKARGKHRGRKSDA